MKVPPPLALAVGPALGAVALRALGRTLRLRREEAAVAPLWAARAPLIYAVWHGRVLLLPYLYGDRGCHVLASRSRDGELVARWIRRFGLDPVRGSSTRGGGEALRRLTGALRRGREVVVVPDGPTASASGGGTFIPASPSRAPRARRAARRPARPAAPAAP